MRDEKLLQEWLGGKCVLCRPGFVAAAESKRPSGLWHDHWYGYGP